MALVALVSVSFAPPARAEDTITTQPYVDLLNLGALKELGISGKGITIALIDGPVDTSAPELQGADITTVTPCPLIPAADSTSHATAMASLLVSPDYGIAPGATIINYAIPLGDEKFTREDRQCHPRFDQLLMLALDNGADIISYSMSGGGLNLSNATLTQADLHGAIIVGSMGNDNRQDDISSFASSNLSVGVAATDIHGNRADYSNYGKGTTVALYGGPVSTRNYATGKINHEGTGTSISTALMSGYLALAMEKWPEATNRQILQSLVRTAARDDGVEWDPGYGYGLANLRGLLTEDPTSLPDENPLLHKNDEWVPSEDFYNDYIDGLLDPGDEVITDPNYIYRGSNSSRARLTPEKTAYGTSPRYHRAPNTPPTPPPNRHHHTPQK
ncbi:S8/S53 family peptidase [Schaalia cardiffensis]|uniref:S8 family peptidase n=1 Tax=Schaalia cardiffensis TaxID=181487 RepID=UPI002AAFEDC0|nr:S8/S53 family peptidase [Schaalia cardiffensis]